LRLLRAGRCRRGPQHRRAAVEAVAERRLERAVGSVAQGQRPVLTRVLGACPNTSSAANHRLWPAAIKIGIASCCEFSHSCATLCALSHKLSDNEGTGDGWRQWP